MHTHLHCKHTPNTKRQTPNTEHRTRTFPLTFPLAITITGVIFRGAPLNCNTFAVVDITTLTAREAAKQADAKAKVDGNGGAGAVAGAAVPASRQQAKVTHLINGFFNMERLEGAESEVVSQGVMDDNGRWKICTRAPVRWSAWLQVLEETGETRQSRCHPALQVQPSACPARDGRPFAIDVDVLTCAQRSLARFLSC